MSSLLPFVGILCVFRIVLSLRCFECNVYEGQEGACEIVRCPIHYNRCINTTYIPVTDVANQECYHLSDKGQSYRGSWTKTNGRSGCLNWQKANLTYNPTSYPGIGLGNHSHCRNPDGDVRPWCYTSATGDFAYCTLPKCFKHQVKVQELSCGWLSKSYCVGEPLGEECKEICDADLCNKPDFFDQLTTEAPTTKPAETTTILREPVQTSPIEKETKAVRGQRRGLSGRDGDGGDAMALRPQTLLILTSFFILTWVA